MASFVADLQDGLQVPEGADRILVNVTMPRDLTGEVLAVFLTDEAQDVYKVSEASGLDKDDTVVFALQTDNLDPGKYLVEVGFTNKDLPPVWPKEGERGILQILDISYNN